VVTVQAGQARLSIRPFSLVCLSLDIEGDRGEAQTI